MYETIEDKMIAFLQGKKSNLTTKEDEQLKRLTRCYSLIETYISRVQVLPILMKQENVSMSTAVKIFNQTQLIFGKTHQKNKDFWLDLILGNMAKNRHECVLKGDFKTVQKIDKDMLDAVGKYFPADNAISFEDVQPIPIMMSSDTNLIEGLENAEELKKVAEKIMNKYTADAEEIFFTEDIKEELNEEQNFE